MHVVKTCEEARPHMLCKAANQLGAVNVQLTQECDGTDARSKLTRCLAVFQ